MSVSPSVFNRDVLAFELAGFLEPFSECRDLAGERISRLSIQKPNHGHRWLLRTCHQGPRRRAAERCNESRAVASIPPDQARVG